MAFFALRGCTSILSLYNDRKTKNKQIMATVTISDDGRNKAERAIEEMLRSLDFSTSPSLQAARRTRLNARLPNSSVAKPPCATLSRTI